MRQAAAAAMRQRYALAAAQHFTPFHLHGAMGASCALANRDGSRLTVWSGTQGPYPLRAAVASMPSLPTTAVRVICAEASGCHGHNGADGVAAETAPIAKTIDKPVRLQWTPAEGHGWEPLGLAMVQDMRGGVTGSSVVAWEHEMCGATHHSRPSAGNSAGDLQGATRVAALPLTWVLPRTPALRSLGGFSDSFAYESFMDELAKKANADSRAQDVVDAAVAQSGRGGPPPGAPTGFARGRGIAFRRCETVEACVAVVAEVMVNAATGAVQVTRVVVAHGYGQIIDPDGLKNQIEGNLIQGISRP